MATQSEGVRMNWLGLLGVVLVVLKVLGKTDLSWWWVTAPFWIGLAVVLGLLVAAALGIGSVVGVAAALDSWKWRKRRGRR